MNISGLGFAKGPSLDQAEWHPTRSDHYQCNYFLQQISNQQYIEMSVIGESTIIDLVSMVIEK